MKHFQFYYVTVLIIILNSCNNSGIRKIKFDSFSAEGEISSDTIYNGLIKFYDDNNKLTETAIYQKGILQGVRVMYYTNGMKKAIINYDNNKIDGEIKEYDSLGNIKLVCSYYQDLQVGPVKKYIDNTISEYSFYNFEKEELFSIKYDTLTNKPIEKIYDTKFYHYYTYNSNDLASDKQLIDLLIYKLNPPKLGFNYNVYIIDSSYKTITELKPFKDFPIWRIYSLDYSALKKGESFAIKLESENEFIMENKKAIMFKKI